jgi:hypothetical protein
MNLSPHFTFEEMTKTGQSSLQAANREEAKAVIKSLTDLCTILMEPIRAKFGPVSVHSGYRGLSVNTAIGGSKTSQHMKGEACDFHCPGATLDQVMKWICTESNLPFGQVILEGRSPDKPPTWIHISLGHPYRSAKDCGQKLVFNGVKYSEWKP